MPLRETITLVLVAGAFAMALTKHGAAVLGPARNLVLIAVALLGLLQIVRLLQSWQLRRRANPVEDVPKKPLGL